MIRGERVDLVAVSMRYLDDYVRWMNDPEVTDMLGVVSMGMSKGTERKWVESETDSKDTRMTLTILTKNGLAIGNMGLMGIDYVSRHATLGIMIGEKGMWDKGFGGEAIRTLLRFAFEELNLDRVELSVNSNNARAIRCYEKAGFKLEGRFREHTPYHGKKVDLLRMAVLRNEWRDR